MPNSIWLAIPAGPNRYKTKATGNESPSSSKLVHGAGVVAVRLLAKRERLSPNWLVLILIWLPDSIQFFTCCGLLLMCNGAVVFLTGFQMPVTAPAHIPKVFPPYSSVQDVWLATGDTNNLSYGQFVYIITFSFQRLTTRKWQDQLCYPCYKSYLFMLYQILEIQSV